jgi:hypothetical protein
VKDYQSSSGQIERQAGFTQGRLTTERRECRERLHGCRNGDCEKDIAKGGTPMRLRSGGSVEYSDLSSAQRHSYLITGRVASYDDDSSKDQ